eukprot:TRINITY_DN626_c0_g1_i11.p2 TRINITY_DN626_c0_g1~~TRINITY_DN626_c0_g1_i11.p2  ORF type:complete len:198 (-),score=18.77 TRINITY_DN626_c0_g1_i11:167-760(-)
MRIAYRDIKPENIMLAANGYLRLIDFGFALVVEEGAKTFTVCGTPEYQAPEVITGAGHGLEADWWGLGILVYEMVTGATPFGADEAIAEDRYEVYKLLLTTEVEMPVWAGEDTCDLLGKLLTKDPAARMGAAGAKGHCFFNNTDWHLLENEACEAPYVPTLESAWDVSLFEEYSEEESELPPAGHLTQAEDAMFIDF